MPLMRKGIKKLDFIYKYGIFNSIGWIPEIFNLILENFILKEINIKEFNFNDFFAKFSERKIFIIIIICIFNWPRRI